MVVLIVHRNGSGGHERCCSKSGCGLGCDGANSGGDQAG
jgi:hypothetical protein